MDDLPVPKAPVIYEPTGTATYEELLRFAAFHEAGHVLVAHVLGMRIHYAILEGTRSVDKRVEGSGTWPTDFPGSGSVTIQLPPEKRAGATTGSGTTQPIVPADTRVSPEVALKANQLQDLTDLVPDLLRATAGNELTFSLKLAIKGHQRPKDDVVRTVNEMLKDVASGLEVL
jgi:hypothetical protein